MDETIIKYVSRVHSLCQFRSKENPPKLASGSELRRWIDQGAVLINGERCQSLEKLDFEVFSLVFFPKSEKSRCTLL